jgi:hypothetical protein
MQFWKLDQDYSYLSSVISVPATGCSDLPKTSLLSERRSVKEEWSPIVLRYRPASPAEDDNGNPVDLQGKPFVRRIEVTDFPRFYSGATFLCSSSARAILFPWLDPYVEVLPITFVDHDYTLVRPITFLECLDREKAIVHEKLMPNGNIWKRVEKYAFDPALIGEIPLFKTSYSGSDTFCSDVFKERIEKAGLTGFRFIPVGQTARAVFRDGLMTVEYE